MCYTRVYYECELCRFSKFCDPNVTQLLWLCSIASVFMLQSCVSLTYMYFFVRYSVFCSSTEEPVTVTIGGDVTELNITGLRPFTSYTLYVEGVTVEIGDMSAFVVVVTLEDGERGIVWSVCVCMCVIVLGAQRNRERRKLNLVEGKSL